MGRIKVYKDELCATCVLRDECNDRDEDMMIDLCSQYEPKEDNKEGEDKK